MGVLGWDSANVGRLAAYYGGALQAGGATVAVIHSAETPELQQSAEGVMNYFGSGGVQASTHVTTDIDSIAASVPPSQRCWGVGEGTVNAWSVQAEQAGYASQDRSQWLDEYSRATITHTAAWGRNVMQLYPVIRPIFLDATALRNGVRGGFTSHAECHLAWPTGDGRTDPGPAYPWDQFFKMLTDQPTDQDLGRLFEALAAIAERNDMKVRLVKAIDVWDPTVWCVTGEGRYKLVPKPKSKQDPIAELRYADMVLPNPRPTGDFAIAQDANGVEMWRMQTIELLPIIDEPGPPA